MTENSLKQAKQPIEPKKPVAKPDTDGFEHWPELIEKGCE